MEPIFVYRLDCKTKAEIPLGIVLEQRKQERGDNTIGMLRLARRKFARRPKDKMSIFISNFRYD